jgi:hypothetical protein
MEKKEQKYYSLRSAVKLTPIKGRETLARYIHRYQGAEWSQGKIWIREKQTNRGVTSMRYVISEEWIKTFNKLFKAKKLIEYSVFLPDKLRYTLEDIERYCEENGIELIKDFISKKRNEEKRSIPLTRNH